MDRKANKCGKILKNFTKMWEWQFCAVSMALEWIDNMEYIELWKSLSIENITSLHTTIRK